MKMLVIGGNGMAGHMIGSYFRTNPQWEVWTTERRCTQTLTNDSKSGSYCPNSTYVEHSTSEKNNQVPIILDVQDSQRLEKVIHDVRPDVVVNAVGVLNHVAEDNVLTAIRVNSIVPHLLAKLSNQHQFQFVHISTDCVFSGRTGGYREFDVPDGTSVYARTKLLGEVSQNNTLTIRTSIIGPELRQNGIGLFHWFMMQSGEIHGYENVFWNGVTTLELAKAIDWSLQQHLCGLVHLVAPQSLSKHQLLCEIQRVFDQHNVAIRPHNGLFCNRTLVNTRIDAAWQVPPYRDMLEQLKLWMDTYQKGAYQYG